MKASRYPDYTYTCTSFDGFHQYERPSQREIYSKPMIGQKGGYHDEKVCRVGASCTGLASRCSFKQSEVDLSSMRLTVKVRVHGRALQDEPVEPRRTS